MKTVKLSRAYDSCAGAPAGTLPLSPLTACGGGSPTETATGTGSETVTEAARDTDTATGQTVDKKSECQCRRSVRHHRLRHGTADGAILQGGIGA